MVNPTKVFDHQSPCTGLQLLSVYILQFQQQSVEEFRGLSSSSQNAQLFKILSAIHDEIGKLKASTDARFTYLENLVHQQQRQQQRAQQQQPGVQFKRHLEFWLQIRDKFWDNFSTRGHHKCRTPNPIRDRSGTSLKCLLNRPPARPSLTSPRFPAASSGHWSDASGGGAGGNSYRAYNSRNAAG